MDESYVLDITRIVPELESRSALRRESQASMFVCVNTRLQLAKLAKKYIDTGAPVSGIALRQNERKRGRDAPKTQVLEIVGILGAGKYSSAIRVCAPKGHCVVDFAAKIGVGQREIEITEFLSQFVERGYTQGFPLFYGSRDFEVRRRSKSMHKTIHEISTCMLLELSDGAFSKDRFENQRALSSVQGLVFQALQTFRTVNMHSSFVHSDLHHMNMFGNIVEPGGHWKYTLTHSDGIRRTYNLPNSGLVFILGDFGSARVRKKGSGSNYEVVDDLARLLANFSKPGETWIELLRERFFAFDMEEKIRSGRYSDPIGDFIQQAFSGMFDEAEGRVLCDFDDNGGDLSSIPLPMSLYRNRDELPVAMSDEMESSSDESE